MRIAFRLSVNTSSRIHYQESCLSECTFFLIVFTQGARTWHQLCDPFFTIKILLLASAINAVLGPVRFPPRNTPGKRKRFDEKETTF